MKIENVIESCHKCRYMKKMVELDGNTFFIGVCEYGMYHGNEDNAHPFTVVCSSTSKVVFGNSIKIPENCPLETYISYPENN